MWTKQQRETHKPRSGRYPSDCSDAEWGIIEPMIPLASRGGRKRETDVREVFNAIRYIGRTGCQWRLLPKDFPPHTTVYRYFWEWTRYGVLDRIHQALLESSSVDPIGDAGKKTKSIKRNAIVDTEGHLLSIEVIPANIQDRDCAAGLIDKTLRTFPRLRKIFADGGYAGPKLASAIAGLPAVLKIVKRTDKDGGFKIIRRRWVIERTFSWLRRNRRLMAHYEALAMTAAGFVKLAMITVMLKRLTEADP